VAKSDASHRRWRIFLDLVVTRGSIGAGSIGANPIGADREPVAAIERIEPGQADLMSGSKAVTVTNPRLTTAQMTKPTIATTTFFFEGIHDQIDPRGK
jgi:hypothetical protein